MEWVKRKEGKFGADTNIIDKKIKDTVFHIGTLRVEEAKAVSKERANRKNKAISKQLTVLSNLEKEKESSKNTILVISGPSGCGKSYLVQSLVNNRPDLFHNLPQATSRERRHPDENGYLFLQPQTFSRIRETLIGRTSHNDNHYGTFPDFKDNFINTIILSKGGLEDLYNCLDDEKIYANVIVLGIDANMDIIPDSAKREGRDKDFLERERRVLDMAHYVYERKDETDYPTVESVVELLSNLSSDYIL